MVRALRKCFAKCLAAVLPRKTMANRRYFELWQERGYHITRNHFYEPVPDTRILSEELWQEPSQMPGIDLRDEEQLKQLQKFGAEFASEYASWPDAPTDIPYQYFRKNSGYGPVDGDFLYGLVRTVKPRRIYEIGSGNSTYCSASAILKNEEEGAAPCELVAFEPYPNDTLVQGFPGLTKLEKTKIEDVPVERFSELQAGDFLFIDSSHVVKIGGDVCYEFLEILPRLNKGVYVHIHDVFLPYQYPRKWVMEKHRFWTEQYLLQAFLAFNSEFEVVWASAYMCGKYPEKVSAAFPAFKPGDNPGGAFWIRRK